MKRLLFILFLCPVVYGQFPGVIRQAWTTNATAYATNGVTNVNGVIHSALVAGAGITMVTNTGAITLSAAGAGLGDVTGPGSATDNAIALFDGATGKQIKESLSFVVGTNLYTGLLSAWDGVFTNAVTIGGTNVLGELAALLTEAEASVLYQSTNANLTALATDPQLYQATNVNLTILASNDGSYLTNSVPGGATNLYQFVTLSQLQGAISGNTVAYFDTLSPADGFAPSGTVIATNYTAIELPSQNTNAVATAANGQYIAAFITTNTFTEFSSGLLHVELYTFENSPGDGSVCAEAYAVNGVTMAEEYEFTPASAYQVVPAGATPTKLVFTVPITDYTSTTNLQLMVKIKVQESSTPDPTIRIVTGGSFPSHAAFSIPSGTYVSISGDTMTGLLSVPALIATDSIRLDASTASKLAVFDGLKYITNSTLAESDITANLTEAEASVLYQATNANLTAWAALSTSAKQDADADLTTWAGITPAAGVGTFLATPTSANLRTAVTDDNGTGLLLFDGATALSLGTSSFTAITNSSLTASKIVLSGADKSLVSSTLGESDITANLTETEASALYQATNSVLTRLAGIGAGTSGDIIYRDANGWTNLAKGTDGHYLKLASGIPSWAAASGSARQEWRAAFDGQGGVIESDVKTYLPVAAAGTIAQAALVADVSGSITITVKRYTPSGGSLGSATTLGTIALSSAVHNRDTTLSGWTTSVSAGDVLEISTGGTIATLTRVFVHISE